MARNNQYTVCSTCRGEGKIVNPNCSVWTEDDRAQDPDGFEAMLAGTYDVPCPHCQGKRVVSRADDQQYLEERRDMRTAAMEDGDYETYYALGGGL